MQISQSPGQTGRPSGAGLSTPSEAPPGVGGGSPDHYLVTWPALGSWEGENIGVQQRPVDLSTGVVGPTTRAASGSHFDHGPASAKRGIGGNTLRAMTSVSDGGGSKIRLDLLDASYGLRFGFGSSAKFGADAADTDDATSATSIGSVGYLGVWQRENDGGTWLLGHLMDPGGSQIGAGEFVVSPVGQSPAAAGNARTATSVVVYRYGSDLFSVLVRSASNIQQPVDVAYGATGPPAIDYDVDRNEFLVVWSADDPEIGKTQVFGRRLDGDGVPIAPTFRISREPGFDYTASGVGLLGNAYLPQVAYSSLARQYLVAWTDSYEIHGRQLRDDGTLLGDGSYEISSMGPPGDQAYRSGGPSVAPNDASGEWFVVWYGDNPSKEVWGRRVTGSAPVPILTSLSPNTAALSSDPITVKALGANFTPGSVVRWNGADLATTYVSSHELDASIPVALQRPLGRAAVTVWVPPFGGGLSAPLSFEVQPSPPTADTKPLISGGRRVGDQLECIPPVWRIPADSVVFQWMRGAAPIDGATTDTYRTTKKDSGKDLLCRVIAHGTGGDSRLDSLPRTMHGTLVVRVSKRVGVRGLSKTGLTTSVECVAACTVSARLSVSARVKRRLHLRVRTLGTGRANTGKAAKRSVRVRLSKRARSRLLRHSGSVSATLSVTVAESGEKQMTVRRQVTISG